MPAVCLRKLLEAPHILELATVCDPLGARTAADSGFQALTLPGYAIGAHLPLGDPLTLARVEDAVRRVVQVSGIPVLVDADANWGDESGLAATVRRIRDAGAAAIQLSSQYLPASVPVDGATERARSHEELVDRVESVAEAGVLIAVRCDLDAGDGYATMLARAAELIDAGADALVLDSTSDAVLQAAAREFAGTPLIYAPAPALPCRPAVYAPLLLQDWGFAGVANKYHACHCARASLTGRLAQPEPHTASQG